MKCLDGLKVGRKIAIGYIAVVFMVIISAARILIGLNSLTQKFSFLMKHDNLETELKNIVTEYQAA